MCLIAFAIGAHARWPLLIAANRDEHFDRPTLPLQRWRTPAGSTLISGRDERAGGTWLGLSTAGRVAMLTNVREPNMAPGARSRGELPLAWLESRRSAQSFLDELDTQAYSGFNLVIGDLAQDHWHWLSNRQAGPAGVQAGRQQERLGSGVYGLSNAFLDTPWPKTVRLRQTVLEALSRAQQAEALREQLWLALANRDQPADEQLPHTGVPWPAEKELSTALVRFPDGRYGTRSSMLVLAEAQDSGRWRLSLEEKSWDPARLGELRQENLEWPAAQ
ncbi:MAG: NRDE family protein [Betaproteobacteria bacterium]